MSALAIGVVLGLAAATAFEAAYLILTVQVRATDTAERPGVSFIRRLARRPWWLVAIALNGAAFGLELAALREASLLVVQPLLAFGLIGLLFGARAFLGEPVTARRLVGVAAIAAGISLVVAGAPSHSARTGLPFDLASVLVGVALLAVLLLPQVARDRSPWPMVAAAMAGDTLVALATNQLAAEWTTHALAAIGALLVVALGGLTSITSESAALQRLPASTVAPLVSGAQVTLPVLTLALLGHERLASAPAGGGLLAAGVALCALGAYELAAVRHAAPAP
jgi:drug/metabolite transporter (DMT)-like permease